MEMLPAACQLSVTSIVGNGTLIHTPIAARRPRRDRGKIERYDHARLVSPTGNTDDVIELGHPPEGPQPKASRSISR
jgi:hypothetical protein